MEERGLLCLLARGAVGEEKIRMGVEVSLFPGVSDSGDIEIACVPPSTSSNKHETVVGVYGLTKLPLCQHNFGCFNANFLFQSQGKMPSRVNCPEHLALV
ncbi:hypothetical protein VNO77_17349 [Canavalia gladiata]|uniref:Uncharacterized protein n=1 Tax=Canavalia gladiata TaxID=3824 RepID=A0AAN9QJA4_CANGL